MSLKAAPDSLLELHDTGCTGLMLRLLASSGSSCSLGSVGLMFAPLHKSIVAAQSEEFRLKGLLTPLHRISLLFAVGSADNGCSPL